MTPDLLLERLAAADPLDGAQRLPEHELDAILANILATPRRPASRRRRRTTFALAAAGAVVATAGVATAADVDWDAILPGAQEDGPPVTAAPLDRGAMQREADRADAALPDPPGVTTPTLDLSTLPDVGGGELGAGASTALSLKQCSWQRAVLDAHASGDAAAEEQARAVLGRDLWYRYDAGGGDEQRAINTDPSRLSDLQQTWDVNCPGGAYDPATHPDAPPIGY